MTDARCAGVTVPVRQAVASEFASTLMQVPGCLVAAS
jgi:hypothetical protein